MNYKSLLFVPAKEKMLNKIREFSADAYIIDLEESILPTEKEDALNRVVNFLENCGKNNIIVRLNNNRFLKEAETLEKFNVGFMLPKFENLLQYIEAKRIWQEHYVVALIETAMGIVNIREIAAEEFVNALAFGAEDYTANLGMKNDISLLQYPKNQIVTYAKAYKKAAYDTPSFNLADENIFKKEIENAVDIGFTGKMAISPKHIEYINNCFKEYDFDFMEHIINKYEECGQAVVTIDGRVYEALHINHMKKIIKESEE